MSTEKDNGEVSDFLRAMPERTLKDLEFKKIIDAVAGYAKSPEGKSVLLKPMFYTKERYVSIEHDILDEILDIWEKSEEGKPTEVFSDIQEYLKIAAAAGAVLEGEALFSIARYIGCSMKLRDYYRKSETSTIKARRTSEIADRIPELRHVEREIGTYLESPGIVRENHPRIKPLIRRLETAKRDRSITAGSFFSDRGEDLQSDRAVYRDGRVVLPVKNSSRNIINGVVHGQSGTGATVFMEPYVLVDKNNSVAIAEEQIKIEIQKIFRELTAIIHENLHGLEEMRTAVGMLDSYCAKAEYALKNNCTRAIIPESRLALINARHPLLYGHAVPIDVKPGDSCRAMIMSGPNAGGKTVTIKTIGIIALMNQYGLFIPALEGSELPVFECIYTDIGDEQSIEESLSTFSGHMRNISDILRQVENHPRSLVILDELGSGTDPIEGAALARSILEYLSDTVIMTLVTSHHSVLKQYAYSQEHMINASMEFDELEKTPTFRVITGLPGESHAIETAQRMSMPGKVVEKAKNYLSGENREVSAIIKGLEAKEREAEKALDELKRKKRTIAEKSRTYDLKILKMRQDEHFRKEKGVTELEAFVSETRKMLENLVREIREGELTREKTKKVKEFIRDLDRKSAEERTNLEKEKEVVKQSNSITGSDSGKRAFEKGMEVKVSGTAREGTLLERLKNGKWVVQIDSMKITLPEDKILSGSIPEKPGEGKKSFFASSRIELNSKAAALTLDVRGRTLQEAITDLDRQIDSALMQNLMEFSIIHGKGDGVLQNGLHAYLRQLSCVSEFEFARPEDGGFGKTIVKLS